MIRKLLLLLLLVLGIGFILARTNSPQSIQNPIHINHFAVTPDSATGGDQLTVSWDVSSVDSIRIGMVHSGNARTAQSTPYANSGTLTLTAPDGVETVDIFLIVGDLIEIRAITLTCRIAWFSATSFENTCPETEAQMIESVYQAFEGGYMLMHTNSDKVWYYVAETGMFNIRPLTMTRDAEIFSGDTPPGLYRPQGDFGYIWEGNAYIREQLGWAIAPEQPYAMRYQQSPYPLGTTLERFRLFTLPDGTIVETRFGEM